MAAAQQINEGGTPWGGSVALRKAVGGRSELYVHGGAHLVPTCSGDFKRVLTAFVDAHGGRRDSSAACAASGATGDPAAGVADDAVAAACGS